MMQFTPVIILLIQACLVFGFPQDQSGFSLIGGQSEFSGDVEGRSIRRPLSAISPNDMRGPDGQVVGLYTMSAPSSRWPKATVAWDYDTANNFTAAQKAIIEKGMQEIQNETCINFKVKTTETAFINFKSDAAGCWATAGYQGTKQHVNMAGDCFEDTSTLIHEVMHALGFHHEQTRYDRDIYMEVQWNNIQTGQSHNFDKYPRTYAFPRYFYDFNSVMQYSLEAFGVQGRPTMVLQFSNSTLDPNTVGKATKMSKTDIQRMRSAYKCDVHGEGGRQPTLEGLKQETEKPKKTKKTKKEKMLEDELELSPVAARTLF